MALLTKGPPALLVFGLLIPFFAYCLGSVDLRSKIEARPFDIALQLTIVLGVGVLCVGLVDLWHFQTTGSSFVERYVTGQVLSSIQDTSEQHSHRPSTFYLSILLSRKYLPWLIGAAVGPWLAVRRKDERAIATAVFSGSAIVGTVLGFGLAAKKNEWYLGLLLPGLSLAFGLTVRSLISTAILDRFFVKACAIPAVILLFLGAAFPSLFEYSRDREYFLAEAGAAARGRLVGQKVAVCVPFNRWTGPAMIAFYLGGEFSSCDGSARFKISRSRDTLLSTGYADIYSGHTFSLLERRGGE